MVNIAILNESTALAQDELARYVAAYTVQANQHFAPLYGIQGVNLTLVPKGQKAPAGMWWLGFFDDADVAGALGYHDLTPADLPLGKVFVKTTLEDGGVVSVTGSHELLEMLGDPWIAAAMQVSTDTIYAFEVCDAVEDESLGYLVEGVKLSDFVMPRWFIAGSHGRYDYLGHLTAPLQIAAGGYIGALKFGNAQWTQIMNMAKAARRMVPAAGSRRERRMRGRNNWRRSLGKLGGK